MNQIQAYLHFSGRCREAMTFYQQCLGGELSLQAVGESPLSASMPAEHSGRILHASLTTDRFTLLASDLSVGDGSATGHSISLLLNGSSEAETTEQFARLASGGQVLHPLEPTFWGALFGDLTDRYGTHWYLNLNADQPV